MELADNITLTSCFNFTSGYRTILDSLIKHIQGKFIPRSFTRVDDELLRLFDSDLKYDPSLLDLCLLPINNNMDMSNVFLNLDFSRRRILYTMWESTRINDLLVEILNKFRAVIVPNEYNKENFKKQGVTCPIHVVPLFCDTEIYKYKEKESSDKFVFGISNEDYRKNLDRVAVDFISVFRHRKDVELQIKTCGPIEKKYFAGNLKYFNKKLTKSELMSWYHNLNVYVSGATCEGWGMMQQESMCCGTPIICTNYGGLREFTSENTSYYVKYEEVYSNGYWDGYSGKWSQYNSDDMIEKMVYCVENKDEVLHKGYESSLLARKFTEKNFIDNLIRVINLYI